MIGRTIVAASLALGWIAISPAPAGAAPQAPRLEASAEVTQIDQRWDRPRHNRRHSRHYSYRRHYYRPHYYRPYAWGYYKPCRVRWQLVYGYYGPQWVATRRCW
jgi:hypothetical protein